MSTEGAGTELLAPELMARVRQIQLRMQRLVTDALAGSYRSTFRGSGIEFEEVRPYQPGDDVRTIDWNRTAQAGEAYVKTYVEERQLTLSFVVDSSASMDFGSRAQTKREVAAQLVALLGYVAVGQQDQVGLQLFADRPGLHLPARKGQPHVARVIREVIAARPTGRGTDLGAVLEDQARTLHQRALLFLVSDFGFVEASAQGGAADAEWVDTLGRLARRHDVVCARIVDPFEEELPDAGWIELEDPETGAVVDVDTSSPGVRAAWAAEAAARRAAIERAFLKARVGSFELSTDGDVGEPLVRFFRGRQRRRGGGA